MARNRSKFPSEAASESSSSESEEENEEEEEEESESEEEKSSPLPPTPSVDKKLSSLKKPDSVPTSAAPSPQPQSSSSDSGSESDSESDSSPGKPRRPSGAVDPNVKPIASKPMEDPPKTKRPRSKLGGGSASATPSKPAATAAAKRPMDIDNDSKDSKRMKKRGSDGDADEDTGKKSGDDPKKQLFQRLWSEDDEIAILKGMVEYSSKKGTDPSSDMNAFHDFIKKSLHVDVTRTQLVDKVRRLKKKFENNLGKGKKGEDRTFSKPHEQKAFELSKKVWGSEVNNIEGAEPTKVNGKARKNQKVNKAVASPKAEGLLLSDGAEEAPKAEPERNSDPPRCLSGSMELNRNMGVPGLEEEIVREGLELIQGAKKSELEEKWRKLRVAEIEVYLKRVELVREQTKLILDALKSSEH